MNQYSQHKATADRVRTRRNFYIHLIAFIGVNLAFWLAELATPGSEVWSAWTTGGWGIGIAAHAFWVRLNISEYSRKWEERQIMALMRKRDGQ